jgi:hypothetical protein
MPRTKKRDMEFRAILRKARREVPGIIDPNPLKPIVEAMEIKNKPVEEQILALSKFANSQKEFKPPHVRDKDEYGSLYSLLSLHYNAGNCRHRAAMLSGLLEAAGIKHEIEQGVHPLIFIELPKEELWIHFSSNTHISVKKNNTQHNWSIGVEGVKYNSSRHPGVSETDTPLKSLKALKKQPEFKEGTNRILLEKAIRGFLE